MRSRLLVWVAMMCGLNSIYAQHQHDNNNTEICGFLPALNGMKQRHLERFEVYQSKQGEIRNSHQARSQGTLIVPVVFHVLHQNDASNISDAQIHD